jgi:hypothetical protein
MYADPNNRINSDWQFRCTPLPAGYAERYTIGGLIIKSCPWIFGIVSAILIPVVPVDAVLNEAQPKVACAYLSKNGLETRGETSL